LRRRRHCGPGVPSHDASALVAAGATGLADRARFVHGDAEALPLADATFDVALSE
jgi:ubiquinone/menaquinone biosynthesis C-methylase UbiE